MFLANIKLEFKIISSSLTQILVIDYLLERFERGQIYTWIDTFLLAINPNGEISIDDIYDLSRVNDPYDVNRKELAPHIFAMAARAHYRIVQGLGKPNQVNPGSCFASHTRDLCLSIRQNNAFLVKVIVLNGETGTGKTFNAWRALEFLTARNAFTDKHRDQDAACCDFVQKITDACRLISAFTVASTETNEISSRHVELVWLEYKMGRICGAMVSSYLLERNRVTMGHCNFQIFYQVIFAEPVLHYSRFTKPIIHIPDDDCVDGYRVCRYWIIEGRAIFYVERSGFCKRTTASRRISRYSESNGYVRFYEGSEERYLPSSFFAHPYE